jgi:hypothetical protein
VDWAGTTIPIHDPRGGPVQQAHLFVAVLGPVPTPPPRPPPTSSWQVGSALTCGPSSSIRACQSWWCRTTPRPA